MKQINNFTRRTTAMLAILITIMWCGAAAFAQTTAFTYQGKLSDGSTAASGTYDLGFALFDAATGGTQIGTALTRSNVTVSGGIFTVQLDFGATAFAANTNRFLQIAVKKTTETTFITLTPRQPLTSSPYSIRTISANFSDALSTACVGCVDNAKIASVAGSKVTGTVANATNAASATTATTAGNVTGVVAIANGGTGSSTQNFVDITNAQTVGGNKTFSNIVTAATLSAGTGGLNMNDNLLRLRGSADGNHGIIYNTTVDGPEFRAFGGFRWANGANGATQRMSLSNTGVLTVNGNITSTGTISGTLANNLVGSAQVADGSLRLADTAFYNNSIGVVGATFGAHGCLSINVPSATIPGLAANDVVTFIPPVTSPAGFYFQPIYVTGTGDFVYNICNTLNGNNTLPAQSYRVFVLRP